MQLSDKITVAKAGGGAETITLELLFQRLSVVYNTTVVNPPPPPPSVAEVQAAAKSGAASALSVTDATVNINVAPKAGS